MTQEEKVQVHEAMATADAFLRHNYDTESHWHECEQRSDEPTDPPNEDCDCQVGVLAKTAAALRILQREGEDLTCTGPGCRHCEEADADPTATEREASKPKRVLVVDDGLDHVLRKVLAAESAPAREAPRDCARCRHPESEHDGDGCYVNVMEYDCSCAECVCGCHAYLAPACGVPGLPATEREAPPLSGGGPTCPRPCEDCFGHHHWLYTVAEPDDEEPPEPQRLGRENWMQCKHCDAWFATVREEG